MSTSAPALLDLPCSLVAVVSFERRFQKHHEDREATPEAPSVSLKSLFVLRPLESAVQGGETCSYVSTQFYGDSTT
jgi:hypothetical protein